MRHLNEKIRFAQASFMSALTLLSPTLVYANPSGGQVVGGSASISHGDFSTIIRQSSHKAIINWDSFSIGSNELVRFIQPGAGAIVLNRVTGADLSVILGELRANGNVFLVNPNGILFGAGSKVDVAGLMATTFDISDADFLAGKYTFAQNSANLASVVNQGSITVGDNGFVYLVAPSVNNSGLIVAKAGQVGLGSGTGFTLDFGGDGLVKFEVSGRVADVVKGPDGRSLSAAVSNDGTISAAGGRVILTGDAARGVVSSVVSNTGVIEATSLSDLAGQVELLARSGGDVINSGSIDVSSASGSAGQILLSGGNVAQLGAISADALADGDGGSITLRASEVVALGGDSATTANAGLNGDGGSILVIGENTALVADGAALSARGGAQSGDGGFVETSGYRNMSIGAVADVSAANGAAGTWLIDPYDIEIVTGSGSTGINDADPFASTADGAKLGVNLITTALANGSNVTITTGDGGTGAGDITLSTDLTHTGLADSTLTLNAHNDIVLNGAISSATAKLNLELNANNAAGGGEPSGSGSVLFNSTIDTNGGALSANGAAITVSNTIVAADVDLTATDGNIVTTGAGHITADTLSLTATKAGATIGAENNAIKIDAVTLNAQAAGGHIIVTDTAGGLAIGTVSTGGDKSETDATRALLTTENGSLTQGDGDGVSAWATNLVSSGAIGTAADAIKTDVHVLSASTEDGGIHVANQNALEQLRLGKILAREGGAPAISDADGNVVLGINGPAGTHDVSISTVGSLFLSDSITAPDQLTLVTTDGATEKGDIFNVPDAGALLTARGVNISASGNVGLDGKALNLSTEIVNASTTGGGVYLAESHGLAVGTITAVAGADEEHVNNVSVNVSAGDLKLDTITAGGGAVSLNSQQGAIIDNNGAAVNVTAGSAALTASKNIGALGAAIGTDVSSLSLASSTAGSGIHARQSTALDSLTVRTTNGAVNVGLQSGGSLSFDSASGSLALVNNGSAPALDFANTGGKIVLAGLNVGSKDLRLEAAGAITRTGSNPVVAGSATLVGASLGSAGTPLLLNADTLDLTAKSGGVYASRNGVNDLVLSASASSSTAANGAVSVTNEGGDMLVKSVSATGAVTLDTTGNLLAHPDNDADAIDITGASANLSAAGSVGSAVRALFTAITGAVTVDSGGEIHLTNSGAVSLLNATANGGIKIVNYGDLTLGQALASDQAVVLNVSGALADGNGADTNIVASSLDISAASIGSTTDKIETNVGTLKGSTTNGGFFLANTASGALALTEVKAVGGDVDISAQGDINLGSIDAAGASVTLASVDGGIRDARTSSNVANVRAKLLDISAKNGIGSADAELVFDVNVLSSSGGEGDVAASNLNPVSVTADSLVGKGAAGVTIKAPSIYILDNDGGVITMDPNGSLVLIATKGNIVFLNPNDTIIAPGGNITFQANYHDANLPGNSGVIVAGNLKTTGGAQPGNITLTAASHITIGLLDAGYNKGDVSVVSSGGLIIDGNGAATNIIGKNVTLKGMTPTEYVAELIRDMAIADYTGKVAEAGADATTVASLTAMRDLYEQAYTQAKLIESLLLSAKNSAQREYNRENAKLEEYQAVYDTLTAAMKVARIVLDALKIPTGAAQAIPMTGDGGASAGEAIADLAYSAADAAMFAYELGTLSPQESVVAELANALDVAKAEYTAGQLHTTNTNNDLKATVAALNVAQAALTAAEHARDASFQVREQAVAAYNLTQSGSIIGTESQPLGVEAARVDIVGLNQSSIYLESAGNLGLGDITAVGENAKVVATAAQNLAVLGTVTSPTSIALTATNGAVVGTSAGKLVADTLSVKAATGIGDLTAAVPAGVLGQFNLAESGAVNTTVDTLAANGGSGGARFVNTNGATALTVGEIGSLSGITAAGDILVQTSGDLNLAKAITDTNPSNAASTVTLTATGGSIIDGNATATNVTGGTLVATAAGDIDLDTTVAKLTANSTAEGDISIRETDGIELTQVRTENGAIAVTAGGAINILNVVSATDSADADIEITAAGGDITVGTLTAGATAGAIKLTATAGAINDDNDNATKITGHTLELVASNGIGVAGASDATRSLDTAISELTARVTTAGAINLTDDDTLKVVLAETEDGNVTLQAGGDLNVDTIVAKGANNTVTLAASGAISDANENTEANITAANLALSAGTGIGSVDNALETSVDKLEAKTATGGIYLTDLEGDLTIGGVTPGLSLPALSGVQVTDSGDIVVKAADSLVINEGIATADGDATLVAEAGSITGAAAITHVSAKDLNATAATGIGSSATPFKTAVDTLTAIVTGAGDIHVNEADSIELTNLNTNEGAIAVTAATGDITVVTVDANGDVALTATAGAINNDGDLSTKIVADALSLTAANGIGVAGDYPERLLNISADSLTAVVTTAGAINIHEENDLEVLNATTPNGDVLIVSEDGSLNVTTIAANGAGNTVTLGAAGSITDAANDDAANITATNLVLSAGQSVGSDDNTLEVDVATLAAYAQNNLHVTDLSGDLTVGTINLAGVGEFSGAETRDGDLVLKTAGSLRIDAAISAGGDVSLTASTGTITGAADLTHVTGKDLAATAAAGIDLVTTVDSASLDVTGAGDITLVENDGARVSASTADGDIAITAKTGDIDVDTIVASGAGSTVTLVASDGGIRDANKNTAANITASAIGLTATKGVGAASNALDIDTDEVTAAGGKGGVYLNNLSSGLVVEGITATGGDIVVTTPGAMTIARKIENSGKGDIRLTTTDTGGTGDVINVNAELSALGGGSIVLDADDSVAQNADITVNGKGGVTVTAGGDIVMADDVTTTAGKGVVTYDADGELVVNKINTDPNRVNGGTVVLSAGDSISTNHPDEPAVTGAFVNVKAPGADIELMRELIGDVTNTGLRVNDRLVGGEISYDASFFGSLQIRSEQELAALNILLAQIGSLTFDQTLFSYGGFDAGSEDGTVWRFNLGR
jgi:filamentous haemagglutinin family N-terminal domain